MKKTRKDINVLKEEYRGTLKQIMKVRGLRTISLYNYNQWKGVEPNLDGIHSLKLDVMSGYLNIYGYGVAKKSGKITCSRIAIENASANTYKSVYDSVRQILEDEDKIPSGARKNILVGVFR